MSNQSNLLITTKRKGDKGRKKFTLNLRLDALTIATTMLTLTSKTLQ